MATRGLAVAMNGARWAAGQGAGFGSFRVCLRRLPVLPDPVHDRDRNLRLAASGVFERRADHHSRDLAASGTGRRAAIEREAVTAKACNVGHYSHLLFSLCARCRAARPLTAAELAHCPGLWIGHLPAVLIQQRRHRLPYLCRAPGPTIRARHVTGRVRAGGTRRRVSRCRSHVASHGRGAAGIRTSKAGPGSSRASRRALFTCADGRPIRLGEFGRWRRR